MVAGAARLKNRFLMQNLVPYSKPHRTRGQIVVKFMRKEGETHRPSRARRNEVVWNIYVRTYNSRKRAKSAPKWSRKSRKWSPRLLEDITHPPIHTLQWLRQLKCRDAEFTVLHVLRSIKNKHSTCKIRRTTQSPATKTTKSKQKHRKTNERQISSHAPVRSITEEQHDFRPCFYLTTYFTQ